MSNGQLDELVEKRSIYSDDKVNKGRNHLIGTNVYADLDETAETDSSRRIKWKADLLKLSKRVDHDFATSQPKTVLLTFGALKDFKPRADFVSGFLATGGIRSEWSPTFTNAADAVKWLAVENPDYAIVCASPEVTEEVMDRAIKRSSE